MIKSRLNKFALILVLTGTILFVTCAFLLILQKISGTGFFKLTDADFKEALFIMTWMSLFCLFISLNILIKLKSITIEKLSKTIEIKNYLTGFKRHYSFKELDGFINSNWGKTEKGNRSIYLVKDSVKIEKISEFTIRNFDEILIGLRNVENLGFEDTSFLERIRNNFRYK
jgi:hypothetical protein